MPNSNISLLRVIYLKLHYQLHYHKSCSSCGSRCTFVAVVDDPIYQEPDRHLAQFKCSTCGSIDEEVVPTPTDGA